MKIAVCFGTRPEIIKLSLLSKKLSNKFDVINVFTGQHDSLFEDVKHLIPDIVYLPEDRYDGLNGLYASLTSRLGKLLHDEKPDLVIVQGDTASSYCAAFSAFLLGIKIGHVEAGLRTYDVSSPFPEELNRQVIDKLSYYNWCPSKSAQENLLKEDAQGKVILTGNTIVDFIDEMIKKKTFSYSSDEIVITLHRRENENIFKEILTQICEISHQYPKLKFVFPVHPNPIIQNNLVDISGSPNFKTVSPMRYEEFVVLLSRCRGIITDSGGIQEEAVCLKKKALICRSNTERQEGIDVGLCRLVGSDIKIILNGFLVLLTEILKTLTVTEQLVIK